MSLDYDYFQIAIISIEFPFGQKLVHAKRSELDLWNIEAFNFIQCSHKFPHTVCFTDKLEEMNHRRDRPIDALYLLIFSQGSSRGLKIFGNIIIECRRMKLDNLLELLKDMTFCYFTSYSVGMWLLSGRRLSGFRIT